MENIIKDANILYLYLGNTFFIKDMNESASHFYRWNKSAVLNENFFDVCQMFGIKTSLNDDFFSNISDVKKNNFMDQIIFPDKSHGSVLWSIDSSLKKFEFVMFGIKITEDNVTSFLDKSSSIYLKNIVDNVPHFIFWKDRQSVFLGCNKIFAKSVGLSDPGEIFGKTDYDLPWGKFEAESYQKDDQEVMETGHAKLHIEETQTTEDGGKITLLTSKVPLVNDQNKILGVLVIYTDITDRKKLEEELIATKAREERLKALSSRHQISHIFDENFYDQFDLIRKKQHVVEFYLIDSAGSFLFLDKEGKPKIFLVRKEEDFEGMYDLAKDSGALREVLQSLRDRQQFPFTPSGMGHLSLKGDAWNSIMVQMHKIPGRELFYSMIDVVDLNILGFNQYRNEIWPTP